MRGGGGESLTLCSIFPQEEATVIARHESGDDDNFTQVGYMMSCIRTYLCVYIYAPSHRKACGS